MHPDEEGLRIHPAQATSPVVLSYLHAFHAGNRADVVKHAALDAVLRALRLQPRPLHYLDSHSGRGIYDLSSAEARKTAEADEGILAILAKKRRPAAIGPYLDLVRKFNPPSRVRIYPGSPAIAAARLRPLDRITLCEKHPREQAALKENFGADDRIDIKAEDGWAVLRAGLRARSDRRLVVLADPSYEITADYEAAIALSAEVKRASRQTILIIWFPILSDGRHQALWDAALSNGAHIASVTWPAPERGRVGLLGSALAVFGADHRLRRVIYQSAEAVAPLIEGTLTISGDDARPKSRTIETD